MSTSLTFTHLRFELKARTAIHLGGWRAGERLRNALANVMLKAVCPENPRTASPTLAHAAQCPVCGLLALENQSGEVRRPYALVPPLPPLETVPPRQSFSFTLTLFGAGLRFLPYFVLAIPEMGQVGVGPGRGQFDLHAIHSHNPLAQQSETILAPGSNVVNVPQHPVSWQDVQTSLEPILAALGKHKTLRIHFLTPTRLIDSGQRVKAPDFGAFFNRLLKRIDELRTQFASEPLRPKEEIIALQNLANQVRLVDSDTRWIDFSGYSNRKQATTPMGGFAGSAEYRASAWNELLPWLILGQAVQVGKLTIKGNGAYQLEIPGQQPYWSDITKLKQNHTAMEET